MLVIERCEKRAGAFTGARMYQLILTEKGLYVLMLGKAMGAQNKGNAISDKILGEWPGKEQRNMRHEPHRSLMEHWMSW